MERISGAQSAIASLRGDGSHLLLIRLTRYKCYRRQPKENKQIGTTLWRTRKSEWNNT
jgi:hypothetical protein